MTTTKEFKKLLAEKENTHLEFKSAKNNFDFNHEVSNYCAAIANEEGGKLILGVTNKDHSICGTNAFAGNWNTLSHKILQKIGIRVDVEEFFYEGKRALIFHISKHLSGQPVMSNKIYWMRAGESLALIDKQTLQKIFTEIAPDFSAEIVSGLKLEDLDKNAINNMKLRWVKKSGRRAYLSFNNQKTLKSLGLLTDEGLNYASLILLGKKNSIEKFLPCSEIIFEWRQEYNKIAHDFRTNFRDAFFNIYDKMWEQINARNLRIPFQEGLIQREILAFSEKPIREAVLNAIAHRDYSIRTKSIFIKASPDEFKIESPGGFLPGITIENALTEKAWRNRKIAETLEKTGLVERSGQGLDDIFDITIREGKGMPNLKDTTDISVILKIPAKLKDKQFVLFLEKIANKKQIHFSFEEIYELEKIREGTKTANILFKDKFLNLGIIERIGKSRGTKYILSHNYYVYEDRPGVYTKISGISRDKYKELILKHIEKNKNGGKMKDFKDVFYELKSMDISNLLRELRVEDKITHKGYGSAGVWFLSKNI